MDRFDHRELLCRLVDAMHQQGSWVGETHIQKCSMFLQKLLQVPTDYQFILYKHGPYSFDLRTELAEMRVRYLLDLKPNRVYAPSYILGHRGRLHIEISNEFQNEIDFVSRELSRKNVVELERVATVYYVSEANPGLSKPKVAELVCQLKSHIKPPQAISAADEVERIVDAASEITGR